MRLATARLAVGEDAAVAALRGARHNGLQQAIDLFLRRFRAADLVQGEGRRASWRVLLVVVRDLRWVSMYYNTGIVGLDDGRRGSFL